MTARIEPTDAELEDWIDGATFVQVKVDIHRNPALWADLQPLYALIEAAEARLDEARAHTRRGDPEAVLGAMDAPSGPPGEHALGETDQTPPSVAAAQADLDDLREQADALYALFDQDKEVWVIRGLDPPELRAILEAHPRPSTTPPIRRPDERPDKFRTRTARYVARVADYKLAVDEEALATAVVEVWVGGERKAAPSLEGLRRLRQRPHGLRHWAELVAAMESVTLHEVAIPAPHR